MTKKTVIIILSILLFPALAKAGVKASVQGESSTIAPYVYRYVFTNESTETIKTVGLAVPNKDIKNISSFGEWKGQFEQVSYANEKFNVVVWYGERGIQPGESVKGFSFTSDTPPGKVGWGVSTDILPTSLRPMSFSWGFTVGPKDTIPPIIEAIEVSRITGTSAIISWYTDEPVNGEVFYGTSAQYGLSTPLVYSSTQMMSGDDVLLSSLIPDTTYHYKITCQDMLGNEISSPDYTFTTIPSSGTPRLEARIISEAHETLIRDVKAIRIIHAVAIIMELSNTGNGDALDIAIEKITASNDVVISPGFDLPLKFYNFESGKKTTVQLSFLKPKAVTSFTAQVVGSYKDSAKNVYPFEFSFVIDASNVNIPYDAMSERLAKFQIVSWNIHWAGIKGKFFITGKLELPAQYRKDDLKRQCILKVRPRVKDKKEWLSIKEESFADTITFHEHGPLWKYSAKPKNLFVNEKILQIEKMKVLWHAQDKMHAQHKRDHKIGYFFVEGHLNINQQKLLSLYPYFILDLHIPVENITAAGALESGQTVDFTVSQNHWFYKSPRPCPGWKENWWDEIEDDKKD